MILLWEVFTIEEWSSRKGLGTSSYFSFSEEDVTSATVFKTIVFHLFCEQYISLDARTCKNTQRNGRQFDNTVEGRLSGLIAVRIIGVLL